MADHVCHRPDEILGRWLFLLGEILPVSSLAAVRRSSVGDCRDGVAGNVAGDDDRVAADAEVHTPVGYPVPPAGVIDILGGGVGLPKDVPFQARVRQLAGRIGDRMNDNGFRQIVGGDVATFEILAEAGPDRADVGCRQAQRAFQSAVGLPDLHDLRRQPECGSSGPAPSRRPFLAISSL